MSLWCALNSIPFRLAWADVKGTRLRYVDAGTGPRTLVFVHGLGGQLELFLQNIAAQVGRRRVVAFDLPGHGYSDKPQGNYEIADYVAGLLEEDVPPAA